MNVPCALSEGLPVGMMLIGRKWDEETVLRAAHAFEQTGRYNSKPAATAGGDVEPRVTQPKP
jgi:amidase